MITITNENINEFQDGILPDGNRIIGTIPGMVNSKISFIGSNNIMYCEEHVTLNNSTLNFMGDDSVIFLCSNRFHYKLNLDIYHGNVFHMGKNNYINKELNVILSEQGHCFVGEEGIISKNIVIRSNDPHLIYDCATGTRQNPTRSIYIGDHVWIGQDTILLKGTQIDSGSIIGAMSLVTGKKIPHNSVWGGTPAKQIRGDGESVFWDRTSVHAWKEPETKLSEKYEDLLKEKKPDKMPDQWIYTQNPEEEISFDEIDDTLNSLKSSREKCDYLLRLNEHKKKNRFVHTK